MTADRRVSGVVPADARPAEAPGVLSPSEGPILLRDSAMGLAAEQLEGFFRGWRRAVSPAEHLRILRASDLVVMAVDRRSGRAVGFVTALSDGVLCAHITLLEVLPPYRRRGIGRALVRRMLERLGPLYAVDAVCDADLMPFYARCGLQAGTAALLRRY